MRLPKSFSKAIDGIYHSLFSGVVLVGIKSKTEGVAFQPRDRMHFRVDHFDTLHLESEIL